MKRLQELNNNINNNETTIKRAKNNIELDLKEAINIVLDDVKQLRGESELISKKQALEVLKSRYVGIDNKKIKDLFGKVCDYLINKLSIDLSLVTANQFKILVSLYTKSIVVNQESRSYTKGLNNIMNKKRLATCLTPVCYKHLIKECKECIKEQRELNS